MLPERSSLATGDEEALVRRSLAGDSEAFGRLYERHLDAIFRYIFFRVSDTELAEELTEEVFVRAWEALPRYRRGKDPFSSWLYRIAHNLVVDHYRRRKPTVLSDEDLEQTANPDGLPEEQVAKLEEMKTLAWAIQLLDELEQRVVILRFVEGLSHAQVGSLVGKSEAACRVIQHRALASLRRVLKDWES